MKNLNSIQERYLKEPLKMRLGHLASDLARISTFIDNSLNAKAVEDILDESKFFIEWAAPEASFQAQVLFSEMQLRIAVWHRHLLQQRNIAGEIEEIKKATQDWSKKILEISGLND